MQLLLMVLFMLHARMHTVHYLLFFSSKPWQTRRCKTSQVKIAKSSDPFGSYLITSLLTFSFSTGRLGNMASCFKQCETLWCSKVQINHVVVLFKPRFHTVKSVFREDNRFCDLSYLSAKRCKVKIYSFKTAVTSRSARCAWAILTLPAGSC